MSLDSETRELAKDLIKFMQSKFGFDRVPRIKFIFDKENSQKSLGMTGGYDHEGEEISVYALNRHPKDVLRSLAHEMLHHVQKCEGMMDGKDMGATANPNYIMHDDFLKNIEADAFERGNICFREWEACKKGDNTMNEAKKKERGYTLQPKNPNYEKTGLAKLNAAARKAREEKGKKEKEETNEAKKATNKNNYVAATDAAKKQVKIDEKKKNKKEIPLDKADLDDPDAADRDNSDGLSQWEIAVAKKIEASQEKTNEVQVNEALKNSHNYSSVTRAMPETAAARDEFVYEELLRKFKIKK